MAYDEDDFDEFMARVNEVDSTIKGLASGKIKPDEVDGKEIKEQEAKEKRDREKQAKKDRAMAEVQAKKDEAKKKKDYIDDHYDDLKEKVDQIKSDRAKKESARKKFGKWRERHSKTLVCDYKGWDIWEPEEDEDDDIYKDCPPPDTPELRAMERDIEERGKRKRGREKLAEKEKENGNRAFKAQQFSEAVRCYSEAIENHKCNRILYNNRALAYNKMRSWASAIEDCDKSLYIGESFEGFEPEGRRPEDTTSAKSYLRRAQAHSGRGDLKGAAADFERAARIMPKDQAIKKQLKRAQLELAEQDKENMVVANAKQQLEGAQAAGSSCHTIQSCLEQLRECEADEAPALLQKLTVTLKLGDDERVYGRSAGAIPLLCQQTYTSAAAYALPALYELSLNQRNLELLAARKGFLSHLSDLVDLEQPVALREGGLSILAEGSRNELCRHAIEQQELGVAIAKACIGTLAPGEGDGGIAAVAATAAKGEALHAQQVYAGTALGNLATEVWFRATLQGQGQEQLLDVLLAQSLSPFVDVAQKAASALTNLASDTAWRAKVGEQKRLGLLVKVLQIDLALAARDTAPSNSAALAEVVQNALGVLANCALEPAVQALLVGELKVLPVMVALLSPPENAHKTQIIARATMVLGRVAKQPGSVELLVALEALPKLLCHLSPAVAAVAGNSEPTEVEEFRLLEAAARLLTGCVMESVAAISAVQAWKGGFEALVLMLSIAPGTVSANIALCLANVAKQEPTLAPLGKAGAVPALIAVAHKGELEQARQNAGIALARLSKHPPNLEELRELHGIEIIHHYVKPATMKRGQ